MSKRPDRRAAKLSERARRVVRDPEPVDASLGTLLLEPLHVLLPGDQVVDLLDLDATEPLALPAVLLAALLDAAGPDLRRDGCRNSSTAERRRKRRLGTAVHR